MADQMIRILTSDGGLRATAADATGVVDEICRRQGTDLTAGVALGRLTVGAALLGSLLKGEQRLALQIEGNGPLQKLQAESDAAGALRASIKHPVCDLPPRDERFDVATAVGRAGFLHVVKDLGLKEPYRGLVQLVSSEIAEDIAWYLTTSEQVPSSVALGVLPRADGSIAAAGGFLIQAMPGADDALLQHMEERVRTFPAMTSLLREGLTPDRILARLFAGIPYREQAVTPLRFHCGCSRKQALRILALLPAGERAALHQEEEISVTCEYCREVYRFTPAELPVAL